VITGRKLTLKGGKDKVRVINAFFSMAERKNALFTMGLNLSSKFERRGAGTR
jgi:hypothetical protein